MSLGKILLVHPGASWSTADVFDGLLFGLRAHGADVVQYRLDKRIEISQKSLYYLWRQKKKLDPDLPKPNKADEQYHAGVGAIEMALRLNAKTVIVVSAMLLHPDVIVMMRRAGLHVFVLFTETPYDIEKELTIAAMVDGCWTNERSSVAQFKAVNPRSGYLPHGWHPEKHYPTAFAHDDIPSHDVVFVGSGFPERVTFFNSIDWTGIDLGLYGTWEGLGLKPQVKACVRQQQISNEFASHLYRKAKVGLNLYRTWKGWQIGRKVDGNRITHAESLSPRAYELAACGVFHLSDYRQEVTETFGDLVPTFTTPAEAGALIRYWLAQPAERARVSALLPACVAESSWIARAKTVLGDLQTFYRTGVNTDVSVCRPESGGLSEHLGLGHRDECDQTERLDDQSDHRQDRSDGVRGREQDVCPGAA